MPNRVADALSRPPTSKTISVMVVEDDKADAILIEELLADVAPELGFEWVQSMAAAKQYLSNNSPDCVLLDLHLTDADGIDALHKIRNDAPAVPVVVLTGRSDPAFGARAVASGAQDYLVKGRFEPDGLRRAVHYAIERKRAETTSAALQASQLRAAENARLERGLLPTPLLRGGVEVVARYRTGRLDALLGGDFYDVVQTDDGLVHVLIGDVSGHGPDEAALGVALRIAWRALVLAGVPSDARLANLDRLLRAERGNRFVFATVMTLTMDPQTREVEIIRAGHPPLLRHGDGRVEWLETPYGPALGIIREAAQWPGHRIQVPTGDTLILITDGVFEGYSGSNAQRLGEMGLLEIAAELAAQPPAAFIDSLIAAAEDRARPYGGLDDDVAVLGVQFAEGIPA